MKLKKTLLALPFILAATGCSAHDGTHDSDNGVSLSNCAIQETIPGAKATGAFLTIHKADKNDAALSIVGAKAPEVTKHVELHEMVMKDGVMKMQQIPAYALKQGDNVFKKGGYHVMLMSLQKKLSVGEKYPITLVFSDGSEKTCEADVKSVADLTPKGMKHMKHGDMKKQDGMKHGDMHKKHSDSN